MLRRHIAEQPTSRLAIWARRTAVFSLIATILAIVIVRSGLLEFKPALATFGGALVFSIIALLLAFAAFVVIWREGLMGIGYSLTAIGIGLALLAYPSYLAVASYRLPWIYDITTDPIDPPRFEALRRPPERGREGRIEAVARTAIMGLREDVVVRVRADGQGSRIDIRSSSRYGSFDFGSNAARVRTLVDDIDDAIGRQKPEQPTATAKKANGPPAKAPPSQPRNR